MNLKCPITIAQLYIDALNDDEEYIKKDTYTKTMPKVLYHFRHLTYKMKKHQGGRTGDNRYKYFTRMRIGEKKLSKNLQFLNEHLCLSIKAGTNEFAIRNKKLKKFCRHTPRRTAIRNTEIQFGDKLSNEEKLSLTGHKHIKTWHHYADKGKILKERTIRKLGELRRNQSNNNNTNITHSTNIGSYHGNSNNCNNPNDLPPVVDLTSNNQYIGSVQHVQNMDYWNRNNNNNAPITRITSLIPNMGPNGTSINYDITGSPRRSNGYNNIRGPSSDPNTNNIRYNPY